MKKGKKARVLWTAAALMALAFAPNPMRAATEEAILENAVWSGYWWPISEGGLSEPLKKYDKLTGRDAVDWEKENNPSRPDTPKWVGFCHAWSASCVMEQEPTAPIKVRRQRRLWGKELSVGDQKGLLAASHASDIANTHGTRYNGEGDNYEDIAPDELWTVLRRYLKEQKQPIVLDISADVPVWNYPVYAYRVTYDLVENEYTPCTLELWLADDAVPKDFVGLKDMYKKYTFEAKFRDGLIVSGSGRWTGESKKDHPDFAWSPYVVQPENPEVDYQIVCDILGTEPVVGVVGPSNGSEPGGNENTEPSVVTTNDEENGNTGPAVVATNEDENENTDPAVVATNEDENGNPVTGPAINPSDNETDETEINIVSVPGTSAAISPKELFDFCSNKPSDWTFDITVDKYDGGNYEIGETVTVQGKSAEAGYLYLFAIDPSENVTLLYPKPGMDNRVEAGADFQVPAPDSGFVFRLTPPAGSYHIRAIVCENQVDIAWPPEFLTAEKNKSNDLTWGPALAEIARTSLSEFMNRAVEKGAAPAEPAAEPGKTQVSLGRFAQDQTVFGVLMPESARIDN